MTAINIDGIITACDTLQRRTIRAEGCMYSTVKCFNACMRAFDCKVPAEAVTFRIYLNAPVLRYGEATIHRDGRMEMRTV